MCFATWIICSHDLVLNPDVPYLEFCLVSFVDLVLVLQVSGYNSRNHVADWLKLWDACQTPDMFLSGKKCLHLVLIERGIAAFEYVASGSQVS